MKQDATIAQGLQSTNQESQYDAAFKRLLSEKQILARIMKASVKEYKDSSISEKIRCIEGTSDVGTVPIVPDEERSLINEVDTVDKSLHEGTVGYDICFKARIPSISEKIATIINVETQKDCYPGYPIIKRGIYYGFRIISAQYRREFTKSHYENLKKVYSIWICLNTPGYTVNTIM